MSKGEGVLAPKYYSSTLHSSTCFTLKCTKFAIQQKLLAFPQLVNLGDQPTKKT